jgi:hypothetical protein
MININSGHQEFKSHFGSFGKKEQSLESKKAVKL